MVFEGQRDEDFCVLDTIRTEKGIRLEINGVPVEERGLGSGVQALYFESEVRTAREPSSGQSSGRRGGITIITKNGTEMVIAGPR